MAKEHKKGSILKKVLTTVLTLGTLAGGFLIAKNVIFNNQGPGSQTQNQSALVAPQNLSFNDKSYMLSWNEVEHADQYKVDVNGKVETVETNSYYCIPTEEQTAFKVQALDSTGEYSSSEWSVTYTYTLDLSTISQATVNNFAADLYEYGELKNVVSMYISDAHKMNVQAVYEEGGDSYLKEFEVSYTDTISSLEDALAKQYTVREKDSNKTVSYDSLTSLLKSDSFAGNMQTLNEQGYEFEAVTSQTVENGDGTVKTDSIIYAVIRATNGSDVKYFQTKIECYVQEENASANQRINYTTKLEDPSLRDVYVRAFHELTGDMKTFYEDMYAAKTGTQTLNTVSYTFSFGGDGMSY